MRKQVLFLTFMVVFCPGIYVPLTHASEFDYRVDLSYSEANPDFSAFANGEGLTWYGRATYAQSVFAFVRLSNARFQPSGRVSGAEVEHWFESGLGYHFPLSGRWALEGNIAYQKIGENGDDNSGKSYQLGLRYRPFSAVGFGLDVGRIDVKIDDWTLVFEIDYQLTDHVYFIGRLRDYADWDFTYYEGGVGFTF